MVFITETQRVYCGVELNLYIQFRLIPVLTGLISIFFQIFVKFGI
jgi:hypothetical protein